MTEYFVENFSFFGNNRIMGVKFIRSLTGFGLKEAKQLSDRLNETARSDFKTHSSFNLSHDQILNLEGEYGVKIIKLQDEKDEEIIFLKDQISYRDGQIAILKEILRANGLLK